MRHRGHLRLVKIYTCSYRSFKVGVFPKEESLQWNADQISLSQPIEWASPPNPFLQTSSSAFHFHTHERFHFFKWIMSTSSSHSSNHSSSADIISLQKAVAETDSFDAHFELVSALQKSDDLDALRSARNVFAGRYPLPASIWNHWLKDEHRLAATQEEQTQFIQLLTRAVEDCPSPSLCLYRLNAIISLENQSHPLAKASTAFEEALWLGAAAHFSEGDLLWEAYRNSSSLPPSISDAPPLSSHSSDASDGCRVFESRLENTSEDTPQDQLVSTFLSYATYVAEFSRLSTVSVFERCLERFPSNFEAWSAYYKFSIGNHDNDRRFFVANRAVRACSSHILAWTNLVFSIPTASSRFVTDHNATLIQTVDRIRPYVMKSDALRDAADLTKAIWTVYQALAAPAVAFEKIQSTVQFNVQGTVQWASAICHAAAVCVACSRLDEGVQLFERVVAVRSIEPRWWLAYASSLMRVRPAEEVRIIFERALNSVSNGTSLEVVEDAWLVFELDHGKDEVVWRVMRAIDGARSRLSEVGGAMFDADARQAPGKSLKWGRSVSKAGIKRRRTTNTKKPKKGDVKSEGHRKEIDNGSEKVPDTGEKPDVDMQDGVNVNEADGKSLKMNHTEPKGNQKDGDKKKTVPSKAEGSVEPKTIYVNNLPFHATEEDLREFFMSAGEIVDVRMPRRSDGASKGLAYIEFENDECVEKAITKRGTIHGRSVWVKRSQPRPKKGKNDIGIRKRGGAALRNSRPGRLRLAVSVSTDQDMEERASATGKVNEEMEGKAKTQAELRAMLLPKQN